MWLVQAQAQAWTRASPGLGPGTWPSQARRGLAWLPEGLGISEQDFRKHTNNIYHSIVLRYYCRMVLYSDETSNMIPTWLLANLAT